MKQIDPRRAAEILFEAMNTRELGALVELLAEDAVFHFPGTKPIEGPDRIRRFIQILLYRYPKLRFTVRRVIADGSAAAAEWTNAGTSRRGEPYENAGVTVLVTGPQGISYLSDTFKDTTIFAR